MNNQQLTKYYYSDRRSGSNKEESLDSTSLPCKNLAIIYKRLSTHEQVQDHVFSLKMQDALADMAKRDGYPEDLIHVEDRDLGLSGTLGSDQREGLAYVIELIEQDRAESVYVVHASRLYRDQTLIDGFAFGELCKKHGVVIVTPSMRLNLRNDMHMRVYRMELDWSAQELKIIKERMHGARDFKGRQGFYAGGLLAAGFILDTKEESPTFEKVVPYEPHATVVRYIFNKTFEHNAGFMQVVKDARKDGVYFPFFPPELAPEMDHRTGLKFTKRHSQGWIISVSHVKSIVSNPIYIGWWLWKQEIVSKNNHPPIVDQQLFWAIQDMINSKADGKASPKTRPLALTGLLICGEHENDGNKPYRLTVARSHPRYACVNSYKNGTSDGTCLLVGTYVLEIPICTFIVAQCSYMNYLDKVLEHLTNLHEQETQRHKVRKRELERLEGEIDNLKAHLAVTKSQEQASLVLEEIEKRLSQKREVIRENANTNQLGRQDKDRDPAVPSQTEIARIREFLSNVGGRWDSMTDELKNGFLASILESITIRHNGTDIAADIKWKTGLVQKLWIRRPYEPHDPKSYGWTKEQETFLREYYPTASIETVQKMLPNRSWQAIKDRAKQLGLRRSRQDHSAWSKPRPWTDQDDDIVRQYYSGTITIHEASAMLGRSIQNIYFRGLTRLGLKKTKAQRRNRKAVEWGVADDGFGGRVMEQIEATLIERSRLNMLSRFSSDSILPG